MAAELRAAVTFPDQPKRDTAEALRNHHGTVPQKHGMVRDVIHVGKETLG
jgi:hypothetical protein